MSDYASFLAAKVDFTRIYGLDVTDDDVHPLLKDHQRRIVKWAVKGGRRAGFAAFGQVVEGLDVVRRIIALPVDPNRGEGAMKGDLDYTDQPLVSSDFNHYPASSTVDSLETAVLEGKLVRVVSWYDNEWGFSNRMLDTAGKIASFL